MKKVKKKLLEINGAVITDTMPESTEEQSVKFNSGVDIAKFLETEDSMGVLVIENTFEKVLNDWNLLEYIHEALSLQLMNDFTEGQLACIFEVLNEEGLRLEADAGLELQAHVVSYIITEGQLIYNLGNVEELVSKITSMYPVIFTLLVSKIRKHYNEIYNKDFQKQIIIGLSEFSQHQRTKVLND